MERPHIIMKVRNGRASYAELFRLRDGVRVGGLTRAELVDPQTSGAVVQEARRRFQPVDNAYRDGRETGPTSTSCGPYRTRSRGA